MITLNTKPITLDKQDRMSYHLSVILKRGTYVLLGLAVLIIVGFVFVRPALARQQCQLRVDQGKWQWLAVGHYEDDLSKPHTSLYAGLGTYYDQKWVDEGSHWGFLKYTDSRADLGEKDRAYHDCLHEWGE